MITFIRHGKTTYNDKRLFSGQIDCDLSKQGIEDTKKVKLEDYDYYYCSELKRTHQTLKYLKGDVKYAIDKRINEVYLGEFQGTPITEESALLINKLIAENTGYMGVETQKHLDARVISFINDLIDKHKEDDKILVVSHSGVIRSIKRNYLNEKENLSTNNLETLTLYNLTKK